MEPVTILTALLPFAQHLGRALIARFTKGAAAEPQNVEEAVALVEVDIRKLHAIAEMEKSYGHTSTWVSNIRAMQRPTVVAFTLTTWVILSVTPNVDAETYATVSNLASAIFWYLFGDRSASYIFRRQG